ncbi:MAG: hypothetical protein C5S48_01355 [Candidatus Methanogaster sp.]|nr:MAG: hypothetical protein C5S48_01355 [ANME-2 cluster archaeon]
MCIPTRDEVHAAYWQGEGAIIQLFDYLAWDLQTLQDQLNKNSKNSSKPHPSDGLKKPRTKSQEIAGQQKERWAGGACWSHTKSG